MVETPLQKKIHSLVKILASEIVTEAEAEVIKAEDK
jgi:hypothetical protein